MRARRSPPASEKHRPPRWRAAVVGTGFIAREHLGCLRQLPNVDVVGVCDLSPAVAEATSDRIGGTRWFTDHRRMLSSLEPQVVHVLTPAASHYRIASDALDAGAHVLVEKPITASYEEWTGLRDRARAAGRWLIESHNYRFDPSVQRLTRLVESGAFGRVCHVDVRFFQAIGGSAHPFADPNAPHPALSLPGGPITDFLPHMASLVYQFLGEHRTVSPLWRQRDASGTLPYDELLAVVDAAGGTATMAFNANSRPEGFWLEVYGADIQARVNLYDGRLTIARAKRGPSQLTPLANALQEAGSVTRAAVASLWQMMSGGPGSYKGLWVLIERLYAALSEDGAPPVTPGDIDAVNRLVTDCTAVVTSP